MNLKTLVSLVKGGKLPLLLRLKGLFTNFYRLCFLASMADTTIMEQLARGPVRLETLTEKFSGNPAFQNAAEAWLGLGVRLGVVKKTAAGYRLRGFMAKKLAASGSDAIRALVREAACLHYLYIMQIPEKLEQGSLFDPDGPHKAYGDVIARSSRTLEPFLFEVIDRVFPASEDLRLLEVGCGYAGYIIYAANRRKRLNAVGLELDAGVAETARRNIAARNMQSRVKIEVEDVRKYRPDGLFDVLTLYNNIYYFPVEERVALLKHSRTLLNPGGRILLTTGCLGGGIEFELVNLIHSATRGWGRLPDKIEMLGQMESAGFERNSAASLLPGDKYYAFVGFNPS